jgi:hypothetical protein
VRHSIVAEDGGGGAVDVGRESHFPRGPRPGALYSGRRRGVTPESERNGTKGVIFSWPFPRTGEQWSGSKEDDEARICGPGLAGVPRGRSGRARASLGQ